MKRLSAVLLLVATLAGLSGCGHSPRLVLECEGAYPSHLQGLCRDPEGNLYWSFTDTLVKTDGTGRLLRRTAVVSHHGDLCHVGGRLYVAVNQGRFNEAPGKANSWVFVYAQDTLAELARFPVPEVVHGAGGIAHRDGHFFVVGGLPKGATENYVYEYDRKFRLVKRHTLASGYTDMGIQTIAWAHGSWWFGCYGKPQVLLRADGNFTLTGRWYYDAALGIEQAEGGRFLMGRDQLRRGQGHVGLIELVDPADIDAAQAAVVR